MDATELPEGGHLAAMEQPELWAKAVMAFFSDVKLTDSLEVKR
jgi:pimeloyl-ACP methyl ester carboxylesterase